jgi:hypothetical protein
MARLKFLHSKGKIRTFDGLNDVEPASVPREWQGPVKPLLHGLRVQIKTCYDAELKPCALSLHERVSPTACQVLVHAKARAA